MREPPLDQAKRCVRCKRPVDGCEVCKDWGTPQDQECQRPFCRTCGNMTVETGDDSTEADSSADPPPK